MARKSANRDTVRKTAEDIPPGSKADLDRLRDALNGDIHTDEIPEGKKFQRLARAANGKLPRRNASVGGGMVLTHQTVGNVGLYYVCYRLSRLGWNVMPTTRNARGVDIVAYSQDATSKLTFQVKSLTRRNAVGLGKNLDCVVADYFVVCRYVQKTLPECFILTQEKVKELAKRYGKDAKEAYWLDAPKYESSYFRENWDKLSMPVGAGREMCQEP